jgi:hypothetical protein
VDWFLWRRLLSRQTHTGFCGRVCLDGACGSQVVGSAAKLEGPGGDKGRVGVGHRAGTARVGAVALGVATCRKLTGFGARKIKGFAVVGKGPGYVGSRRESRRSSNVAFHAGKLFGCALKYLARSSGMSGFNP